MAVTCNHIVVNIHFDVWIQAGESLEEAVRRETWEETGIEVGEVVYHSSQPWPGTTFET